MTWRRLQGRREFKGAETVHVNEPVSYENPCDAVCGAVRRTGCLEEGGCWGDLWWEELDGLGWGPKLVSHLPRKY